MPEHLTPDAVRRLQQRAATTDELVRFGAHLDACPECRDRLRDGSSVHDAVGVLTAGAEESHLDPDTILARVDGTLDAVDREIAESHLADCMQCRREVRDLDAFRRSQRPQRRLAIFAAAAAAVLLLLLGYPALRNSAARPGHARAAAVSLLDGGRRVEITGDGRVSGLAVGGDAASRISAALTRGTMGDSPRATALRHETESLRGMAASGAFAPVVPIGCIVVTQQPTFEWTAMPGARYKVEVFGNQFRAVAQSELLETNRWTVSRPLAHGETYAWQVTAYTSNGTSTTSPAPPAPEARFAVIDPDDAARIDQLQQMQPQSHLALGVAYAEAGAAAEAERELEALNTENRGSDPTARLLRAIRARR